MKNEYKESRRKDGGECMYNLAGSIKLFVGLWPHSVLTSPEERERYLFGHYVQGSDHTVFSMAKEHLGKHD